MKASPLGAGDGTEGVACWRGWGREEEEELGDELGRGGRVRGWVGKTEGVPGGGVGEERQGTW